MCKSYCALFTPVYLHASDLFKLVGLLSAQQKNESPWQHLQAQTALDPVHDGYTVPSSGWRETYHLITVPVLNLLLHPFSSVLREEII